LLTSKLDYLLSSIRLKNTFHSTGKESDKIGLLADIESFFKDLVFLFPNIRDSIWDILFLNSSFGPMLLLGNRGPRVSGTVMAKFYEPMSTAPIITALGRINLSFQQKNICACLCNFDKKKLFYFAFR
jgi:hypothetical protein